MPAFVIFVDGADTEPAKLPVYIVESEEHASLICEGMKESDYQIFDFSFKHCTRSDRGRFAVWATMIHDAREGVYGNIVGGIYKMIDGAYSIMSQRRSREKIASGADQDDKTPGDATATAKPEEAARTKPPVDPFATSGDFFAHLKATGKIVLTDDQQAVFDYIRKDGPKTGKEIVSHLGLSSESTLTRHIIPALKPHGVLNKRGAGYYIPAE